MTDSESIVALRVAVAHMSGMLEQALSDHGSRLTKIEGEQVAIHARLNEKGKTLATHAERIKGNSDRIDDLEDRQSSGGTRIVATAGVVIAALALLVQFLPIAGLAQ